MIAIASEMRNSTTEGGVSAKPPRLKGMLIVLRPAEQRTTTVLGCAGTLPLHLLQLTLWKSLKKIEPPTEFFLAPRAAIALTGTNFSAWHCLAGRTGGMS